MPRFICLILALTGVLGLNACAKRALPFVEVGKTYTFYLEHDIGSNWVRGKVRERTDDGWFLVKFENKNRWLNGRRVLFVSEEN